MLDINQQSKNRQKTAFSFNFDNWMFRNGFVKIFLAALDFQADGLMDMQASRLKIATALPFVGRYRSDQLFCGKFDLIARRSLVCESINKNIEERPAIGKQSSRIFVFSINSLPSLTPRADFLDAFSVRSRALLINDQRDLQLLAFFGEMLQQNTRIQS